MSDLISRQAAIDLFPNDALEWDTNGGYIAPHFARRMIEELPSAQPVRHGKWIKHMKVVHHENFDSYTPWWQCSECGQCYDSTFANICNYCYYCGAKMDEKRNYVRYSEMPIRNSDSVHGQRGKKNEKSD